MTKKGMLLVGHGSKLPHNKELIEATADMIRNKSSEFVVKTGFMSLNSPSIEEQLEEFRKEDIDLLVVVPLFLARGMHINRDIPAILGLEEGEKLGEFALNGKNIPLLYASPIGSDPLLADLMLKNAHQVIDENL
ncbi:MAG: sirohydrochlorin nickelochelatase [Methanomicrobiales archaeon]